MGSCRSLIYRKCSHAKQAALAKSSRLRMSEENFRTELSRITFYDYIIYLKLLITVIDNSSILYSKEKTDRILGT